MNAPAAIPAKPAITLSTKRDSFTAEGMDLGSVLNWALVNWSPAQGIRHERGGFYLNQHLMVAFGGGEPMPIREAMEREGLL